MHFSYGWVRGSRYNAAPEIMYKHAQGAQKVLNSFMPRKKIVLEFDKIATTSWGLYQEYVSKFFFKYL